MTCLQRTEGRLVIHTKCSDFIRVRLMNKDTLLDRVRRIGDIWFALGTRPMT